MTQQTSFEKFVEFLKNFLGIHREIILSYGVCISELFGIQLFEIFRGIFLVAVKNFKFLCAPGASPADPSYTATNELLACVLGYMHISRSIGRPRNL